MKSIKILGIAVATLGVAASIGGAIALYTQAATDTGFGIGAGTYTGKTSTVTYKINDAVSPTVDPVYWNGSAARTDGGGLDSTYKEIKYTFTLGATFAEDLVAQDYVMGNLAINFTVPEAQRGHVSLWASIEGYTASTVGKNTYEKVFMTSDYAITAEHQSYSDNKDVCVARVGTQALTVYVKYDESVYGADLLTKDEAGLGYTLSVTWGAVSSSFDGAFVVGSGTQWAQDDEFAMYPNINAASWEWMYQGLVGSSSWTQAKCNITNTKGETPVTTYSDGDNATLESGHTYNVYWNGSGSSAANFDDLAD